MDIPAKIPVSSNIKNSENVSLNAIKAILNKSFTELKTLIDLNVRARGEYCNSPEEADIIFIRDASRFYNIAKENAVFVTLFDRDVINTQLLGEENKEFLKPVIREKDIPKDIEGENIKDKEINNHDVGDKNSVDDGIDF